MSNTTIRCKLICRHVGEKSTDHDGANPLRHVRFDGVTEQDDAIFGKYTPCADFSAVIQAEVAERLEIGAAYYFDIHQVSAEAYPADCACEHAANAQAAAAAPAIPLLDEVIHERT